VPSLLPCQGHGTHVASLAAGLQYGVAKGATLIPVLVMDCQASGQVSTVIRGLEWVVQQELLQQGVGHPRPAVALMSLAADASPALDNAVLAALSSGLHVVVAAGNQNTDACLHSPARLLGVTAVGGVDPQDGLWWDSSSRTASNSGPCIDLMAPAGRVVGASSSSDSSIAIASGTSQAAPFVAGAAAMLLELHPSASPEAVQRALVVSASPGNVKRLPAATANLMLDTTTLLSVGLFQPLIFSQGMLQVAVPCRGRLKRSLLNAHSLPQQVRMGFPLFQCPCSSVPVA